MARPSTASSISRNIGSSSQPHQGTSQSQQSGTFNDLMTVVTTYSVNHTRLKRYHVSLSIVRFLALLNFIYTFVGVTFLFLALGTSPYAPQLTSTQKQHFLNLGLIVSVFAPVGTIVDLLALRGLYLWKRALLLPWLFLYAFVIAMICAHILSHILNNGFSWTSFVFLVCIFVFYSAWRHLNRQYDDMVQERPVLRTMEDVADDLLAHSRESNSGNNRSVYVPSRDPPPKYDDLDLPPSYTEYCQQAYPSTSQSQAENQQSTSSSPALPNASYVQECPENSRLTVTSSEPLEEENKRNP